SSAVSAAMRASKSVGGDSARATIRTAARPLRLTARCPAAHGRRRNAGFRPEGPLGLGRTLEERTSASRLLRQQPSPRSQDYTAPIGVTSGSPAWTDVKLA